MPGLTLTPGRVLLLTAARRVRLDSAGVSAVLTPPERRHEDHPEAYAERTADPVGPSVRRIICEDDERPHPDYDSQYARQNPHQHVIGTRENSASATSVSCDSVDGTKDGEVGHRETRDDRRTSARAVRQPPHRDERETKGEREEDAASQRPEARATPHRP